MSLKQTDQEVWNLIEQEKMRQKEGMELIPSENYVSEAVLEAMGSIFTNKYSEGFPGRRYYGGQQNTDILESLTIKRATELFKCDHANVQALSGAPANMAAYFAWCEPGDTIMGMELTHGGHLTHGKPETHVAKLFNFVRYKIKDLETGEIDYDQLRELALETKPKIILAGHSSFPRNYDYSKFKAIADEVGAIAMADIAHLAGLVAGGVLDNPFDFGFQLVTTTTHKTLRGPRGGMILTRGDKDGNPLKPVEKTLENLPVLVDRSVFPGMQGGPHMATIAGLSVALGEASKPEFKIYAKQILDNAQVLANELMNLGCKLITNGTSNHMMLIDTVKSFNINGRDLEIALDKAGITLNKNVIPDDPLPPYKPSGVRLGTPAITTRGMKEEEMKLIAKWIVEVGKSVNDDSKLEKIKNEVSEMCLKFPVPGIE
jgi:glycine hydroxymethyltransferase